jgi:tetratricopeptide (TPR) repeat protein
MSDQEMQDIKAIKDMLDRLASAQIFDTSKAIVEIGHNYFKSGNLSMSLSLFERAVELDDPLFATQALISIAQVWRQLGRHDREKEIYERIATLPEGHRKFADPGTIGVAMSRSGHPDIAKRHYLKCLELYPDNLTLQSNLAELYLTLDEFKNCIDLSSRVAVTPAPQYQIIGRLLKGSALYLSGDRPAASEEFHWIGKYLLSIGSVPPAFSWDFGDSRSALEKVDLAEGQLIIQLLDGHSTFPEFATNWAALIPVPRQA